MTDPVDLAAGIVRLLIPSPFQARPDDLVFFIVEHALCTGLPCADR